jgi:hypothetical protein
LYLFCLAGLFGLASVLIHKFGGKIVLQENGIVEWIQILWLAITALLLFQARHVTGLNRELLFILALMPVIALVRELDDYSDTLFFHGSWKYIDMVIVIYMVCHARKSFKDLLPDFEIFTRTQPFIFFVLGFFIVFAFARIFGQQSLWRVLLEETYHRKIGRLLEEYLELLGYSFILLGALEIWFDCKFAAACAPLKAKLEMPEVLAEPVHAMGSLKTTE